MKCFSFFSFHHSWLELPYLLHTNYVAHTVITVLRTSCISQKASWHKKYSYPHLMNIKLSLKVQQYAQVHTVSDESGTFTWVQNHCSLPLSCSGATAVLCRPGLLSSQLDSVLWWPWLLIFTQTTTLLPKLSA